MNTISKKIKCPICSKPNTWHKDNPFRPFCSERCRLIDLGEWAKESYHIKGESKGDTGGHENDDQNE